MFHRVLLHDGKRGEDCVNERAANETRAGFRLPLLLCRSHATAASTPTLLDIPHWRSCLDIILPLYVLRMLHSMHFVKRKSSNCFKCVKMIRTRIELGTTLRRLNQIKPMQ